MGQRKHDKERGVDLDSQDSQGEWHSADELATSIRRSERSLKTEFDERFPEGGRKQAIRARWQETMIGLEKELLTLASLVADDTRGLPARTGEGERQLLVKNIHLRMGQLAWSAVVDIGSLVLGIVALRSGDVAGGATGSALSIADLVKNVYESFTRLTSDQVELYRATARLEYERRTQNLEPPFATESEVIEAVVGQLEGNAEARHDVLRAELSAMIGDSLVSKDDERVAVY